MFSQSEVEVIIELVSQATMLAIPLDFVYGI